MKNIWKKFVVFWKELGNVLTNILCPIMSIVAAAAELLQLPTSVIQAIKKAEYWCWYACGTKKTLDEMIDKIDDIVDNEKDATIIEEEEQC